MDALKQTRQYEANLKLLFKLSQLIQKHPEQRFSQLLNNYGFTRTTRPAKPELCLDWCNDFYLASEELLARVEGVQRE